jgi:hypothetical protein
MARVAGIAFLKADGVQYDLVGNFSVSPSMIERAMLVGQDGVHGFSEMPRAPYIEGDIRLVAGLTVAQLDAMTNATVTAELATGAVVTLQQACTTAAHVINTRDGIVHVRWEGVDASEF